MQLQRAAMIIAIAAGVVVMGLILFSGKPSEQEKFRVPETSDATFKKDILESALPVLVDFWAPWCGPCRIAGPIIDRVGEKVNGKASVFKLDVDKNPQTASTYGITGIPTVIVFRNGKVDKTFMGVQSEQVYSKALGM